MTQLTLLLPDLSFAPHEPDHDFSPMLSMLRNRQYTVVLIEGQRHTKPSLRVAADVVYSFEDVMGRSHLLSAVSRP